MEKKRNKRTKIMTIGTDPEFFLIDQNGYRVNAGHIPFFSSSNEEAKIGCDTAGDPVELRPNPTPINKINVMIDDIDKSFKRIARYCYFNDLTLRAGAIKESRAIGGHIHFGSKKLKYDGRILFPKYEQKHIPKDILFHRERLIDCMDTFFMPIANILISEREIYGRINDDHGDYGVLHQYRPQPWGIEYRTPYSFLISPITTKALFSLAALIANNYTKFYPTKGMIELNGIFYDNLTRRNNDKRIRSLYKIIKPIILQMMKYRSPNPHNNSSILSLFSLIEQKKKVKTLDVLENYNLKKPPTPELTIFYGGNDYMYMMRNLLVDKIKNKNFGEVYIYKVGELTCSIDKKAIYLSEDMPKIICPKDVKVIYKEIKRHKFVKNSMGFSCKLLRQYHRDGAVNYLIRYLNKLKLENDDK